MAQHTITIRVHLSPVVTLRMKLAQWLLSVVSAVAPVTMNIEVVDADKG